MMKILWRWFTVGVVLSIAGTLSSDGALLADEIEILSITPMPAATISGVAPWPAGGPMPTLTASNSVTVVVRYRTDGAAVGAEAFAARASERGGFRVADPAVGSDPPCSSISGPSEGRCAAAFLYVCEEGSPATITIEQVGATLGDADGRPLVSDYEEARITVRCSYRTPPRDPGNCLVLGVPGVPGPAPLPFSPYIPICRCLRDEGAREFRCAFLHPDFFMIRRIPLPVPPRHEFSEVWEFMPLTELRGAVTMRLTGGGLVEPVVHVFDPKASAGGNLDRLVAECVSPHDPAELAGFAEIEYVSHDGQSRTFRVDRTLDEAMQGQQ